MFYISQNRALRDRGEMRTLRRSSSAAPAVKGGKEEEEGIVGGCIPIYSSTSLSLFPGGMGAAMLLCSPGFPGL